MTVAGLSLSAAAGGAATSSTARKAFVVLAKRHATIEPLLDVAVAVEVIRRLEGKEGRHTHDHGVKDLVTDVEIVAG
jgi:hypothetical protein